MCTNAMSVQNSSISKQNSRRTLLTSIQKRDLSNAVIVTQHIIICIISMIIHSLMEVGIINVKFATDGASLKQISKIILLDTIKK